MMIVYTWLHSAHLKGLEEKCEDRMCSFTLMG
jgi:hypothetical protein